MFKLRYHVDVTKLERVGVLFSCISLVDTFSAKPVVSTSQASVGPSSSARTMLESPRPEHDVRPSEEQAPCAPTS